MSATPFDGTPRLNEVWSRLDGICNKLWREDRQCAVGLQALVEEFRAEVDRAEKTVESLRSSLAIQRKTVEQEVCGAFEGRVAALCEQLADLRRAAQNMEEALARERGRNAELRKAVDAKAAEIAELNESHLKAEAERHLQYAEKARLLRGEVKEMELRLETEWEKRRQQLDAECAARLAQARQIHAGEIQALKTRVREIYKDCLAKENSLGAAQEALGKELESLIQEYQSKKD